MMVNHQASKSSLDKLILQVFEEQEDKFSFPLTTQKQTRDFVRLLNHQGFTYEMLSEEIGEKFEVFRGWRLGSGPDAIGKRVMTRINKPIQEAMSCEVGTEEERILCNGLVEESKTITKKYEKPDEVNKHLDRETKIGEVKENVEIAEGSVQLDSKDEKNKVQVKDVQISSELEKPSVRSSSQLIRGKEAEEYEESDRSKDISEAVKGTPNAQSKTEGIDNEILLDKKKISDTHLKTSQMPSVVVKTKPDIKDSLKEKKENPDADQKYKVSAVKDRTSKIQDDDADSCMSKDSESESSGSDAKLESNEPKPQINAETLKKGADYGKTNDCDIQKRLTEDENIRDNRNEKNLNDVLEKADDSVNKLSSAYIDEKTNRNLIPDGIVAFKSAPSDPKQTSMNLPELTIDSSLAEVISGEMSSGDLNAIARDENVGQPKQVNATNKATETQSNVKNRSAVILAEEQSKLEVSGNTESHLRPPTTKSDPSETKKVSNQSRSLSYSSVKEPESTTYDPDSIKSSALTASTPPSLPLKTGIPPPTGATDTKVDENYDSDLDLENSDHSTQEKAIIEKLRSLKTDEKQNGPGYLYLFSDTPAATGTGKHRIRIGVSRFPEKRFQQALLFNPDIRLVTSVAVKKRNTALQMAQVELKHMSLRGKQGWYWGSLDVVVTTITQLIEKQINDQ